MIVPNLMVTDMVRSLAFYRDVVGLTVEGMVTADRRMLTEGDGTGAVFATLTWDGAQLMLQTNASLAEELSAFAPDQVPTPAGTIYFRGLDPDPIAARAPAAAVIKPPFRQWYGMWEIYLRDPDGHMICCGVPKGEMPA